MPTTTAEIAAALRLAEDFTRALRAISQPNWCVCGHEASAHPIQPPRFMRACLAGACACPEFEPRRTT